MKKGAYSFVGVKIYGEKNGFLISQESRCSYTCMGLSVNLLSADARELQSWPFRSYLNRSECAELEAISLRILRPFLCVSEQAVACTGEE